MLYYYDKFEVSYNRTVSESNFEFSYEDTFGLSYINVYSGYTVNKGLLIFEDVGTSRKVYQNESTSGYQAFGNSVSYLVFDGTGKYKCYIKKLIVNSYSTRGKYIETITAENNFYPSDGIKEGYWYVRKGLAWIPPNIQTSINNSLKTYDNGWICIDKQLRQIENIYIKINNELREV